MDDIAIDNPANPIIVKVSIKASKTDPFRKGVSIFLGRNDYICPIAALLAYLAAQGHQGSALCSVLRQLLRGACESSPATSWHKPSPLFRTQFQYWCRNNCSIMWPWRLTNSNSWPVGEYHIHKIHSHFPGTASKYFSSFVKEVITYLYYDGVQLYNPCVQLYNPRSSCPTYVLNFILLIYILSFMCVPEGCVLWSHHWAVVGFRSTETPGTSNLILFYVGFCIWGAALQHSGPHIHQA